MVSALEYFNQIEKPLAPILYQMSVRGVHVNLEYLKNELKPYLESQFNPIDEKAKQLLGVTNVNSDQQVIKALEERFAIVLWKKNKRTRGKEALIKLPKSEIRDLLLTHSELGTLLDTFVYKFEERNTEYVHPFFNQVGTRTGRLSCSNPNLLQIPTKTENGKRVRRMFIPRDGFTLGSADYGQIEPRVMAHLSKDPTLCEMFNAGTDFHTFTADRLGISRDRAKVLNLSVGYRATFKSVGAQLGVNDEEAQAQIDKWWSLFPTLRRWQDRAIYDSQKSGVCTTLLGRKIRIDSLNDPKQRRRESAERQLINNIAQASAREIMALGMIKISRNTKLTPTFGLLIQIYDDLVFESEDMERDLEQVKSDMVNAVKLDVPLTVKCKTGPNWADCR